MDFERDRIHPGATLKVDTILEALDADSAKKLRDALADPANYNDPHIARTVTNQTDHNLSSSAVRTWRERNL